LKVIHRKLHHYEENGNITQTKIAIWKSRTGNSAPFNKNCDKKWHLKATFELEKPETNAGRRALAVNIPVWRHKQLLTLALSVDGLLQYLMTINAGNKLTHKLDFQSIE